jgi:hypothetical protein
MKEEGEYSYGDCYDDLQKKLADKGINYIK